MSEQDANKPTIKHQLEPVYRQLIGDLAAAHEILEDAPWEDRAYALALLRAGQGYASPRDTDTLLTDFMRARAEQVEEAAERNRDAAREARPFNF